ncbi:MAG: tetratricopeptide repeat protein [Synechococcales bacterium]|nr:tetratricopeptide repeat protein [Synechococcales bacterium]
MDISSLPIVYLSILVIFLAVSAVLVVRQVVKTRRVETRFNRLQNKLTKEKGTAQEYYELSGIYLDKKLYIQAITLLQKALKAKDLGDGENAALVYNALGFAYASQEQYDLAIRQYKEALDRTPDYVTCLNNLGFAYEKKQLAAQALETYEEALKHEPKNSVAKRRAESLRKRFAPAS